MQLLLYDGNGFMFTPVYPVCAGLVTITVQPLLIRMSTSPEASSSAAGSFQ
jgi:hypothetical protein